MAEQPRARLAPAASTSALPMRRPSAGGTVSPQASASSMAEISRAPSASSSSSAASSSAAAAAASQRRARSLLKNFYALDKASSEPSVKSDPTNIDHPTFDAEMFYSQRLRSDDLQQLMRTHRTLSKDVKELDGSMKTLVYENYNKFISATDTIRQMKRNVENMEEEINRLSQTMKAISSGTESVNSSLHDNREQIEKLSGVSTLLKKRQFLFELPSRLNKCIASSSHAEAIRYYNGTRVILDKYKHLPSFLAIYTETERIMGKMKQALRESLTANLAACDNSSGTDATRKRLEQVAETMRLLLDLNEDPTPLRKQFLTIRTKALENRLVELDHLCETTHAEPAEASSSSSAAAAAAASNESTSADDAAAHSSSSAVPPTGVQSKVQTISSSFLFEIVEFFETYRVLFLDRAKSKVEGNAQRVELETASRDSFTLFSELIYKHLKNADNVSIVVHCLGVVYSQLVGVSKQLPQELALDEKGTHIVNFVTGAFVENAKTQCMHLIAELRAAVENDIMQQKASSNRRDRRSSAAASEDSGDANSLAPHIQKLHDGIRQAISTSLLQRIMPFFTHTGGKMPAFLRARAPSLLAQVCAAANAVLSDFARAALSRKAQATAPSPSPARSSARLANSPSSSLVLAKVCLDVVGNEDGSCVRTAERELAALFEKAAVKPSLEAFDAASLRTRFTDAAQRLLMTYVRVQGRNASKLVRSALEAHDWLAKKELKPERMVLVLNELDTINAEIASAFREEPGAEDYGRARPGTSTMLSDRALGRSLLSNKFYQSKEAASVSFNRNSIMCATIKLLLKSFTECVRLCTFGTGGFQQVQVDVALLRMTLGKYVSDKRLLDSLLDEVAFSAAYRCKDPTPLDATTVQSLLATHAARR